MGRTQLNPNKQATEKLRPGKTSDKNRDVYITGSLVLILLVTFFSYYPCVRNGFTNWDDDKYITENPVLPHDKIEDYFVKDKYVAGNYHPLTMISYSLEYAFVKLNPRQYHIDNLILHLLNTTLVFWFIFLLTGYWQSAAVVAVLFGVHPMHVESVAWVSERKDVLYTFFYFASLIAYIFYVRHQKPSIYIVSLLLFLLSLFSKGQAVTLPLILLLIDYFHGRKYDRKTWFEKIPFFLLSIFFGAMAFIVQKTTTSAMVHADTFINSVFYASYGLMSYVFKLFFPFELSCIYNYPDKNEGFLPVIFYSAPVVVVMVLIWIYVKWKNNKSVVFGTLFFLMNIAPLLQLIKVGNSITSDRYSYIPYVGLFFIFGQLLVYFSGYAIKDGKNVTKSRERSAAVNKFSGFGRSYIVLLLIATGVFTYVGNQRCRVWKDSETLWKNVLENYPDVSIALINLGSVYNDIGKYEEAGINFKKATDLNPRSSMAWMGLAKAKMFLGNYDAALADINHGILLAPSSPDLYYIRGNIYSFKQMFHQAIPDYKRAITSASLNPGIYNNLANCYTQAAMYDSAVILYNTYIEMHPDDGKAHIGRGIAWAGKKKYVEAIKDYDKAQALNVNDPWLYLMRSKAYLGLNNKEAALKDALQAKKLGMNVKEDYLKQLEK